MAIKSGIYQIRCLTNGRVYIGSSINIQRRWGIHRQQLRREKHYNPHLQQAWNKHGPEQFVFEILEITDDLLASEERCIQDRLALSYSLYNMILKPLTWPGGGQVGKPLSPERKAKLSAYFKGRKTGPRSPEVGAKISAALKGRPLSAEHRVKVSAGRKGIKPRPRTAAHCVHISEALTGKPLSLAHRAKISATLKGKIRPDISAAQKGVKRGPYKPRIKIEALVTVLSGERL